MCITVSKTILYETFSDKIIISQRTILHVANKSYYIDGLIGQNKSYNIETYKTHIKNVWLHIKNNKNVKKTIGCILN
jgi:hypothetical protein